MTQNATFICGGSMVPASRFRIQPVADALSQQGWETEIIYGYGNLDQRIHNPIARRLYRTACRTSRSLRTAFMNRNGPILVQRMALPWLAAPEATLARRNQSLIFDFDDAVFLGGKGTENALRRRALRKVFNEAAHVVTGNSWLAEHVVGNVPVSVIPTCIDTSYYRPAGGTRCNARLRIGWIGTGGNFPYLRQLEKPLSQLRAMGHSFELVICSDVVDNILFKRLDATFIKWTPQVELPFLQSLDIGLMPLADDDWCKGKCSFKMIQYMSVGCPTVASAVGMNMDVLTENDGGRLVYGENWIEPLVELMQSREIREKIALQARERAVERYDISVAIAAYQSILSGLQH